MINPVDRAVEVLRRRASGAWSVGSGYLVGGRLVLTAAHNVLTDGSPDDPLTVRRGDVSELPATILAADRGKDIALLQVPADPSLDDMPVVRFARVDRHQTRLVENCWAIGYPGWNEHLEERADVPLRDSVQIQGVIPPGSHVRRGLLELRTTSTPEPLGPRAGHGSQWRGMSGAVVFSDDPELGALAVGVITQHHLPEGASTLTVAPVTGLRALGEGTPWWRDLKLDNWAVLPRAGSGTGRRPTRYAQLGRAVSDFTDRERVIAKATVLLTDRLADSAPVVVLHGMAGVGKTQLATQIAHRLAPTFRHARIQVDLGGGHFDVSTDAAMIQVLQAFGLTGDSLPPDAPSRRAELQKRLSDGPSLLVLDNVAEVARIVPLLPVAPGSAALLTSRSELPSVTGADRLPVEPLPSVDALRLFERIVGVERIAREPDAANDIVALLGGLPLAIRITGGNVLALRKTLSAHATLLADERQRISQLEGQLDGEDIGVRSTFELSYRALRPDTRRLFRHLGLLAGADFVPELAASCADTGMEDTERLLGELADRQLVEVVDVTGGRYRLHDLLRLYAREHAEQSEPETERHAAVRRSLEWYANRLDGWMSRPGAHELPPEAAIGWFTEEHLNVQAAVRQAYDAQEWEPLLALAGSLYGLLFHRSHWEEMEAVKAMAVEAARRLHDEPAELGSLIHLAEARRALGRRQETTGLYERALDIARGAGDQDKEGWILTHFGDLQCDLDRPQDGLRRYADARALYQRRGDKGAEIWLAAHMGDAYRQLDRPQDAARVLEDALAESGRRGDDAEIVWCQWHLALAYDQMGRYAEAEEILSPAIGFHRDRGDQAGLATMLTILGDIHLHAERPAAARAAYGEALELVRSIDAPRRVAQLEAALERTAG
ncbi:tetratricopeptide repeat protein [Streptomyces sp. HUAS TT20]|uniref:tetratricopeptide repeat protein n=1 Tax=Streptomyces sp. HUAS TT20 TaxID=3447509 RepID=UPI0021D85FC7|nr:tetratricopeptide repeat protein [Streptomyces sp. HUAS 15-9]UXY30588.1 tetratricopeptide repeat protein [Streptomyces sp. HUAS 15-9]